MLPRLAKMATLAKMPVITTASVPQGPNDPLIAEIHENAPHAQHVARKGEITSPRSIPCSCWRCEVRARRSTRADEASRGGHDLLRSRAQRAGMNLHHVCITLVT